MEKFSALQKNVVRQKFLALLKKMLLNKFFPILCLFLFPPLPQGFSAKISAWPNVLKEKV